MLCNLFDALNEVASEKTQPSALGNQKSVAAGLVRCRQNERFITFERQDTTSRPADHSRRIEMHGQRGAADHRNSFSAVVEGV